ncbi:MAG: hypothetical protein GF334_12980 [Candidatus Altiarchaeales archaeon]|nr:hypothetical protein [Candidatus Altiarchaeales archaeon]
MPYAIPANIKYEERLVGPFTIKQSIYLAIGLGIGGWIYFGNVVADPLRQVLALAFALLGGSFAMFDLDKLLLNMFNFMRQEKTSSWISPAARKLMNIKSIRADAVYLKDGRILGVLGVTPINFGILSENDKDTVIYGFLEFLNGLNYPIQIVMRSVNLDLEDYLRHLKRRILQRDDRVALAYFEHFSEYMKSYISSNQINDRHFYIIVPAKKRAREKQTIEGLETQCEELISRLSISGIVSERLNTHQLINLYSSYFTETFEVYDRYISPITMYRRMWKSAPKPYKTAQKELEQKTQTPQAGG